MGGREGVIYMEYIFHSGVTWGDEVEVVHE